MKIKLRLIICCVFACISFYSCEKDRGPLLLPPPEDTTSYVSFKTNIQPIFDVYCVRCHNESHPFLDLRPEVSYNELLYDGAHASYVNSPDSVEGTILMLRLRGVTQERMPPEWPYPPDMKIDLVRRWIEQGAENN
jgi:hypothetical protein